MGRPGGGEKDWSSLHPFLGSRIQIRVTFHSLDVALVRTWSQAEGEQRKEREGAQKKGNKAGN